MRLCAYRNCRKAIDEDRPTARFCNSSCRAREHDQGKLEGADPDTFWAGIRESRRLTTFARARRA